MWASAPSHIKMKDPSVFLMPSPLIAGQGTTHSAPGNQSGVRIRALARVVHHRLLATLGKEGP